MIHAALWVASFLFLLYVGLVALGLLVLAWRWILGAIALLGLSIFLLVRAHEPSNSQQYAATPAGPYATMGQPHMLQPPVANAVGAMIPIHAIADPAQTDGWRCMPTYHRLDGECVAVVLPVNAEYYDSEQGWRCDVGFVQDVNKCILDDRRPAETAVTKPAVPAVKEGGCVQGFRWITDGCYPSDVPEHAVETYTNGWDCVVGYVRKDNGCVRQ